MNNDKINIFLVDDDVLYLKVLENEFLEHADFNILTFPTGELCIQNLSQNPDLIILDYYLDGIYDKAMNGLDTLDKIKLINPEIPVVILSAQDKIEVAVNCMHRQAYDYVIKSETAFLRLQKIITSIFMNRKLTKELNWYMERM